MKIPNHKSSFQKIQKWRKIEILLDPNSKPQKFFKKNPEMEKPKTIAILFLPPVIERDVELFHHKKFGIRKRISGSEDRNKGSTSTDESEPMDESTTSTTEEPKQRISLNNNNTFAASPPSIPLSLLPRPHPHQYPKSDTNLITNVKIEKIDVENESRALLPPPPPPAAPTPPHPHHMPHPPEHVAPPL